MKKMVKKLSALLMAVIMVLAMSATAFAAKVEDTDLDRVLQFQICQKVLIQH